MTNSTIPSEQNTQDEEEITTETINDLPVKKLNVDDGFFELTDEQIKNLD